MAGGTFDKSVGKVRPGTYINFESTAQESIPLGTRGVVLIPLVGTNYGPAKEFITISATAKDAQKSKLGYGINDDDAAGNMLLIREAFKNAVTVIVYICTEGTAAATAKAGGLTATARYKGSRGNDLTFAVIANPIEGFDVEIYLDGSKVEFFEGVTEVSKLSGSEYITFEGETLSAVAGTTLTGGADPDEAANADIAAFLDAIEGVRWNTMAFPLATPELQTALKTRIKYMRETIGRGVQAVAPDFAGDYEGIINLTNSYSTGDKRLTTAQATAYVAGATASATATQSNTAVPVSGAVEVVNPKTHEEAETAIKAGEYFFSVSDAGEVVSEYDINSLVTLPKGKDKTYRKNRVILVMDSFAESLQLNFPPNKFDNNSEGWDIMEGLGAAILKQYGPTADGGMGAIKNVDYSADFLVDRELSNGDETFFNVGLEPTDSAEKLYFTVKTR